MRAYQFHEFGIENLKAFESDVPEPGPFEALVRLKAASLNFRDLMVVEGTYNPKLKRPMIPLSDGAGVVEKIGPGVTRFREGDRVTGAFMQEWIDGDVTLAKAKSALGGAIPGVLAEFRVFRETGLTATPSHLTDVEAATLPCAGVTAWRALFEVDRLAAGSSVLIQGTGGVSIFALQLAAMAGLRTIVISSSDEKLEHARTLGATHGINYKKTPAWSEAARKITPEGVDCVVEVGGSGTIEQSLKAVRMGGTVVVIGGLSGVTPSVNPVSLLMNTIRAQGIYVGSRTMLESLGTALALHNMKPVVDKVFPWNDAAAALRSMKEQSHFGKICIDFTA